MSASMLFVYGTLRQGGGAPLRALLRRHAEPVGPARLRGTLYRVGDYPAAVPDERGWVWGEIYRLRRPEPLLAVLDAYEEVAPPAPAPGEYRRDMCPVWPLEADAADPAAAREAWVYLYNLPVTGLKPIPGGDFLGPAAR